MENQKAYYVTTYDKFGTRITRNVIRTGVRDSYTDILMRHAKEHARNREMQGHTTAVLRVTKLNEINKTQLNGLLYIKDDIWNKWYSIAEIQEINKEYDCEKTALYVRALSKGYETGLDILETLKVQYKSRTRWYVILKVDVGKHLPVYAEFSAMELLKRLWIQS